MKRCIGGLDAAFSSLEEEQFRNEVDEKIVLPLEENLKFYCDKKAVEECICCGMYHIVDALEATLAASTPSLHFHYYLHIALL